jgi:hypothetical protein
MGTWNRLAPLLLVCSFSAVGCVRTSSHWQPHKSGPSFGSVVAKPLRIYRGDIEDVAAVRGVEVLGVVYVSGNKHARESHLQAEAEAEAGARGGTHILMEKAWESYRGTVAVPAGNTVIASPVTDVNAAYIVLRVPPERWPDLPEHLRPRW